MPNQERISEYILHLGDPGYVTSETHGFIAVTVSERRNTIYNGSNIEMRYKVKN